MKICPMQAISVPKGIRAEVDVTYVLDAESVRRLVLHRLLQLLKEGHLMLKQKRWYDYLWIFSAIYLFLGLFNIFFA